MSGAILPSASRGWTTDGHPHKRDRIGFCGSCGARNGEAHYRLTPPDPMQDPEGRALVQAIHDRKAAQG